MIYKLVVISDLHHAIGNLVTLLPVINASDYLIFCGDGIDDILLLRDSINVPLVCVRGNNDANSNIAEMASIVFGNTRALVTHGHKQNVRQGLSTLFASAKMKHCSLVLFGHTHSFCDYELDGVHFINPGALFNGSYALVVGDGNTFTCKHEFLDLT